MGRERTDIIPCRAPVAGSATGMGGESGRVRGIFSGLIRPVTTAEAFEAVDWLSPANVACASRPVE